VAQYKNTCLKKTSHKLAITDELMVMIRTMVKKIYTTKHIQVRTRIHSIKRFIENKSVTIAGSNKYEIKLLADSYYMVTTWCIVSVVAQANFHCQLKRKLLQITSSHSLN